MANWSGDVVARLAVDATGKVTNCNIALSGGMRSVDDFVCRSALRKGRFEPAIGADVKPTAAFPTIDARFRVSDHAP